MKREGYQVTIVEIRKRAEQGVTLPFYCKGDDHKWYWVKGNLAGKRALCCKWLAGRIGQALGLPLPRYTWDAPCLVLTLYRSPESATRELSDGVLDKLNVDEKAAWQFIVSRESATSPQVMEHLSFDERKAQRVLKKLMDVKLISRIGKGPATRYEVLRS